MSILEVWKKSLDSLNLSTVYRHLNQLVGSGRMVRINHPEKGVLYEQANLPHHHHFFVSRAMLPLKSMLWFR